MHKICMAKDLKMAMGNLRNRRDSLLNNQVKASTEARLRYFVMIREITHIDVPASTLLPGDDVKVMERWLNDAEMSFDETVARVFLVVV